MICACSKGETCDCGACQSRAPWPEPEEDTPWFGPAIASAVIGAVAFVAIVAGLSRLIP